MRFGVIGLNNKLADLRLREALAKACHRRFSAELGWDADHHGVLLSTCNRTEVYFCSEDLAATHTYLLRLLRADVGQDLEQKVYSFFGQECLLHLARVTTGLDSAIIGETEIQGQVRLAYEQAMSDRKLPKEMHFLFQKALKVGKQVRTSVPMSKWVPDLEHAVLSTGGALFLEPKQANLLFVGASDINNKILSFLKCKGFEKITICNRTDVRGGALAGCHGARVLPWEQRKSWVEYDWVIFGTKAPEYVATLQDLPQGRIPAKLVIDLSVPRNVDPAIASRGIQLLNIDEIQATLHRRCHHLADLLASAEELVASATRRQVMVHQRKDVAQMVKVC